MYAGCRTAKKSGWGRRATWPSRSRWAHRNTSIGTKKGGADHTHTPPPTPTLQTIAIYGYSLCAFVPLTLLNFVPNNSVPWLSELLAAGASAVFLLKALGPTVREKAPQQAVPFLAALG